MKKIFLIFMFILGSQNLFAETEYIYLENTFGDRALLKFDKEKNSGIEILLTSPINVTYDKYTQLISIVINKNFKDALYSQPSKFETSINKVEAILNKKNENDWENIKKAVTITLNINDYLFTFFIPVIKPNK